MKKRLATLIVLFVALTGYAQKYPVYYSTGGELIFSGADVSYGDEWGDVSNNVRFTAFFHLKSYMHFNKSEKFGFFTGFSIRNIGINNRYVNMDPALQQQILGRSDVSDLKMIQRTYTAGIPLVLKYGNMDDRSYFFAGAEIEMAFHYKEKHWNGEEKLSGIKKTAWFSSKTETFLPSVLMGGQFPGGVNITFKYYLTDFLNTDYTENGIKLYEGTKTNMFYVSLGVNLFHVKKTGSQATELQNAQAKY